MLLGDIFEGKGRLKVHHHLAFDFFTYLQRRPVIVHVLHAGGLEELDATPDELPPEAFFDWVLLKFLLLHLAHVRPAETVVAQRIDLERSHFPLALEPLDIKGARHRP